MRVLISITLALLCCGAALDARAAGFDHFSRRTDAEARMADDEGSDDEGSDDEAPDDVPVFVERFAENPLLRSDTVVAGEPQDRLAWSLDAPAWPGDSPGSLTADYKSNQPAGLYGFPLPAAYDETEAFTAAAAFVISGEGFSADPDGFFQISWGLWSTATTGLDRTGSFEDFATDTFELIAFDWFPNVSPFFGGPFLSPAVFGAADTDDPDFPFSGAFANFTSLFGLELDLPRDVPLLAVIEHRPELDALAVQVYRILSSEAVLPLDGAVGVVPLGGLAPRQFAVDAVGLTLWHDGFGGPSPAVVAHLKYHVLAVAPGVGRRPEEWLHASD